MSWSFLNDTKQDQALPSHVVHGKIWLGFLVSSSILKVNIFWDILTLYMTNEENLFQEVRLVFCRSGLVTRLPGR